MSVDQSEFFGNWISGQCLPSLSGKSMDVFEPATGQAYARVACSDSRDVDQAVAAARAAFPAWSTLSPEARSQWLRKVARALEAKSDVLAAIESKDTGKPLKSARERDIARSVSNFDFFADAITQFSSESYTGDPSLLHYTLRQPVGVVAAISPWNLPLYLLTWKIAPAIAAGNCVVAKPSEITPASAHALGSVLNEVGFPKGVINILQGVGAELGERLTSHPQVAAVTFTGSTRVGGQIAGITAPLFKKLSLELGGKNPFVVFADADVDLAVQEAVRASFSNQGQICLCGSRLLIEKSIYAFFKDKFISAVKKLNCGDPLSPSVDQGALTSKAHFEKVEKSVKRALEEGGTLLCGGGSVPANLLSERCKQGYFFLPTVIEGLPSTCQTNQEEIFGPIVTLAPFETEEEALSLANGTSYGLAASVFTRDLSKGHRMAQRLECGIVWMNCWMVRDLRTPFGGKKTSGVGREGGLEALRFFTEPKSVTLKLEESLK